MTADPSNDPDAQPQPEQNSTDGPAGVNKFRAKVEPDVYTSDQCRDSTSDPEDAAEVFLSRCIDEVRAELAEKQELPCTQGTPRAADAALIEYVSSYIAIHPDRHGFLRALRRALQAHEPAPLDQEHADA